MSPSLSDPAVETLWRNVLDHWDEEPAHHAFLQICRERGRLADAAARYRGMSGDPARSDVARKKLAAITLLAFAELEATRSEPKRSRWQGFLLAFLIAVFLALLAFGIHQFLHY